MVMRWFPLLASVLSLIACCDLQAQERTWTNRSGVSITASLVDDRGDVLVIRKGVRNYTIPFDSLSESDQVYIENLRAETSRRFRQKQEELVNQNLRRLREVQRMALLPGKPGVPSINIFGPGNTAWGGSEEKGYTVTNLTTGQTLVVSDEGGGTYAAMDLATGQRFAIASDEDGTFSILELN